MRFGTIYKCEKCGHEKLVLEGEIRIAAAEQKKEGADKNTPIKIKCPKCGGTMSAKPEDKKWQY